MPGMSETPGVPGIITCIECGGDANLQSYAPPDAPFVTGDVVAYVCADCDHRMDLVVEDAEDPLG